MERLACSRDARLLSLKPVLAHPTHPGPEVPAHAAHHVPEVRSSRLQYQAGFVSDHGRRCGSSIILHHRLEGRTQEFALYPTDDSEVLKGGNELTMS